MSTMIFCTALCINAFFGWDVTAMGWNLGKFSQNVAHVYSKAVNTTPYGSSPHNTLVVVAKSPSWGRGCADIIIIVKPVFKDHPGTARFGQLRIKKAGLC